jgi:hypothetical protein
MSVMFRNCQGLDCVVVERAANACVTRQRLRLSYMLPLPLSVPLISAADDILYVPAKRLR